MSNHRYLEAVRKAQGLTVAQKHVLLALATRVKRAGVAWPSERMLALDTGMRRRSVHRVLQELEDIGLVHRAGEVPSKHGRPVPKRRLDLDALRPLADRLHRDDISKPDTGSGYWDGGGDAKPDPVSPITGPSVLHNLTEGHIELPGELPGELPQVLPAADATAPAPVIVGDLVPFTPAPPHPANGNGHHRDAFDEFWALYPRKVAKAAARKAWAKAVAGTPAADILAGLQANLGCFDPETKFIPHPSTWLNSERWTDAPPPQTGPRSAFIDSHNRALALLRQIEQDEGRPTP